MTVDIGRNVNVNDEARVPDGIVLNTTTSVIIAPANDRRIAFHVNNNDQAQEVWVKLQPALKDNTKKGIFLDKLSFPHDRWDMPPDNVYTGEISAIANIGNPTIYVTEY